jgi:valyl-tRNA synthetase
VIDLTYSIGNVIDPIDTIDAFGSDALRYTLVTGSTPGQDIPLSLERVETNRNFGNKLWNAGTSILYTIPLPMLNTDDLLSEIIKANICRMFLRQWTLPSVILTRWLVS